MPLVIEAVFEDVDVKHQVIREVEAAAADDLIFASNTSTIPIARLAEASQRPENMIGMHFFSPVHKMPLIEIIKTEKTSDEALATTVEIGRRMGKTIIVVNDGPGFFTSRVLGPFVNEALWCLVPGRLDRPDRPGAHRLGLAGGADGAARRGRPRHRPPRRRGDRSNTPASAPTPRRSSSR